MYKHLFSPVRIGTMELKNRVSMSPMGVEIAEADGHVREPMIAYYEERAKGGAGLITTEVCAIAYPRGANAARQIAISSDEYLPGLQEMTSRVHLHGAKMAVQLVHHGKMSRLDQKHGRDVLIPSIPEFHGAMTMANDLTRDEIGKLMAATGGEQAKYKVATPEDIAWLIDQFASATERARRAGFDGVEIHAAHGYIISGFLSPAFNLRDDEYGGAVENRARLLQEVLRACKQRAGEDFPIWCRLDLYETEVPNGIQFEDTLIVAKLAQEAGADAIHFSAYGDSSSATAFTGGTLIHKPAGFAEMTAEAKTWLDIPVIAVGRLEPDVADAMIRDGKCDVIAMGRKMLADPHIARKLEAGKPEDVRPCIYCYTCVAQPFFDNRVRCAVNPVTAYEEERSAIETTLAPNKKNVVVVGGGPSGLEAARVSALRGHDVTLLEKSAQLGGTLRFASLVYEPNERLLKWLTHQVKSLGVDVRLETEATAESVRALSPDALIIAVGPSRGTPDIPGIDKDHVFDGDHLRALLTGDGAADASSKLSMIGRMAVRAGRAIGLTSDPSKLREASKAYMPVGKRVAVVGGGLVGCELAEFMSERGREVIVLEEGRDLATEMAHPRRWRVLHDLREHGVELVKNAHITEITDKLVRFEVPGASKEGPPQLREFAADTVVVATGLTGSEETTARFAGLAPQVELIGDCTGVTYIEGAIHDGFNAGANV